MTKFRTKDLSPIRGSDSGRLRTGRPRPQRGNLTLRSYLFLHDVNTFWSKEPTKEDQGATFDFPFLSIVILKILRVKDCRAATA